MLCFLLCKKQRCYPYICKNAFLQNVRKRQNAFWRTFSKGKCSAYILRSKMFSITFSKEKCSAKQNVTNVFDALLCFAKIHFCIKYIFAKQSITFCWCKNAVFFALQKTKMLPLHFVGAKMHLMQKCI